jgi:hypothetical protein
LPLLLLFCSLPFAAFSISATSVAPTNDTLCRNVCQGGFEIYFKRFETSVSSAMHHRSTQSNRAYF